VRRRGRLEAGLKPGMTRRAFLQGSALTTAVAGLADPGVALAAAPPVAGIDGMVATGPEPLALTMNVNGSARTVAVEPRTTLAEALRGPLALTGTKIACNRGACSACTVLLDGDPVCSCMLLALDVGARKVTTIEGLASGERLHPVQEAFIAHDAVQCGFCTPGMLMSCAALIERIASPSAEDVAAAIGGHICRCGTYPHVVAATLAAAAARGI